MKTFIDENIEDKLFFDTYDLDEYMNEIKIDKDEEKRVRYLFKMMKKLPASMRNFHGTYEGGLYDHVLLVTNLLTNFGTSINDKIMKSEDFRINLIKAGLYHDLGKIDDYTIKGKWEMDFEYRVSERDLSLARFYAQKDFKMKGKDTHVEKCFVILRNAKITVNPEIEFGIAFHHGGWSKYFPKRSSPLSSLLHSADLIAAQYFRI